MLDFFKNKKQSITKNTTALKNKTKLIDICSELISKYETEYKKSIPSCKEDLIESISKQLDNSLEELSEWQDSDTDYVKIAHTLITSHSFDLLVTGKYHLYTGMLNTMSCAYKMLIVYDKCMQWALENGYIEESTKNQQRELLMNGIKNIG